MNPPIEVAAAIIEHEGRILIAQRPPGGHLPLLWEFPGGKREPGETLEQCLGREIAEEVGIEVLVRDKVQEIEHHYPEKTVRLTFYRCDWLRGEPRPLGCHDLRWVTRSELTHYDFPGADRKILSWLCWQADVSCGRREKC